MRPRASLFISWPIGYFNAKIERRIDRPCSSRAYEARNVEPNTAAVQIVTRIRDRAGEYFGNGHLHCGHVTSIVRPACDRVKQLRDDQCHDHITPITPIRY